MDIPGRGRKGGICICKDSVAVVRMGLLLRRLTVGCCFP